MKNIIDEYKGNKSYRELAREWGIPHSTLMSMYHGGHEPRLSTLQVIADATGYDVLALYKIMIGD